MNKQILNHVILICAAPVAVMIFLIGIFTPIGLWKTFPLVIVLLGFCAFFYRTRITKSW